MPVYVNSVKQCTYEFKATIQSFKVITTNRVNSLNASQVRTFVFQLFQVGRWLQFIKKSFNISCPNTLQTCIGADPLTLAGSFCLCWSLCTNPSSTHRLHI